MAEYNTDAMVGLTRVILTKGRQYIRVDYNRQQYNYYQWVNKINEPNWISLQRTQLLRHVP